MATVAPSQSPFGLAVSKEKGQKRSGKVVMAIVYVALLVDYTLTTTVVPIVPNFFVKLDVQRGRVLANETSANAMEHTVEVGFLFCSKSVIQMLSNIFAGPLTTHFGYSLVMFVGFVVIVASTLTFAFSRTYATLFMARSVQGIGSSFTMTGGLGLISSMFTEEADRGKAMGIVLGGAAVGCLLGPTYGGVLYEYSGIELPFVILAGVALLDGALQAFVLRPRCQPIASEGSNTWQILKDPYILIAAGGITMGNMSISILEPSLPLWTIQQWKTSAAWQGILFLPLTLGYLINTQLFGAVAHKYGRARCGACGLLAAGIVSLAIPFCPNEYVLMAPILVMGLAVGVVDSTMFPTLGTIADQRHASLYGAVMALADSSICAAFAVGPFLVGPLVRLFGFKTTIICTSIANILYAPVLLILQRIEGK